MNFERIRHWTGQAFSDNGTPSSSRLLTLLHSFVSCGTLIYIAIKTGGRPDASTIAGLGAFATAPYAVNRVTTAWGKDKKDDDKGV